MALKVKAGGVRRDITAIKVKQGTNRRDIVAVFERQGHTRRKLWTHPTAPQITSFSINPTFANDDTYTAASPNQNVAISWAITSTPALTGLTLEYTRRDGINGAVAITTTSRSASVVMERQDATYTLTATNANGSTHAVAKFTYRHYPTISRFTRTGFSQSPGIAPSRHAPAGLYFCRQSGNHFGCHYGQRWDNLHRPFQPDNWQHIYWFSEDSSATDFHHPSCHLHADNQGRLARSFSNSDI